MGLLGRWAGKVVQTQMGMESHIRRTTTTYIMYPNCPTKPKSDPHIHPHSWLWVSVVRPVIRPPCRADGGGLSYRM